MYLSLLLTPFLIYVLEDRDHESPSTEPQASWGCNNKPYLLLTLTSFEEKFMADDIFK